MEVMDLMVMRFCADGWIMKEFKIMVWGDYDKEMKIMVLGDYVEGDEDNGFE